MRALLLFQQLSRSAARQPLLLSNSCSYRPHLATRALASFAAARPSGGGRARARLSLAARAMASQQQFPPQQQGSQPGKEHAMDPRPEAIIKNYKSANKLKDKVALVTGGDSGIGRAVCLCFALEGATVAFTFVKGHEDKDAAETLQALRDIKSRTGARDPMAVPADLGYEDNCRRVVEEVAGAYGGRIDVLVNNAAEQYERPCITEVTEADLDRVFRTNIFSYFLVTKYTVPHMAEGGSIVNTSSVNAYKGNKTLLDYTATKGAIVAFTRALALQLADKGIRVNGVAPGPIWTPLIPASFGEEKVVQFGSEVPMKRAGQPAEVAPSYVFLASEQDSSYMSGQFLHVNGKSGM
ncbi:Glucose and ribitol dehydrogenase-like protein [Dichanthelium oligosanthes]|uniref:Glucose and ribitol dehydrogenase-like protein n=1 Tax=Dichanthelium oligosanthes TaxID=888268 RepID=A0A1E5UJU7_9POAL|nr:Glucose and ribitol dehydrogenase-like protein [Dichanthelium oligosanthes]